MVLAAPQIRLLPLRRKLAYRLSQTLRAETILVRTGNEANRRKFSAPTRQLFGSIRSFARRPAIKVLAAV
jgi:hypothetical protein